MLPGTNHKQPVALFSAGNHTCRSPGRLQRPIRLVSMLAILQLLAVMPAVCNAADNSNGSPSDQEMRERNASHYYIAAGSAMVPDYEGSDYYQPLPLVIARWIKRGRYIELQGAKLRANLIAESLWQFGPVLRWDRARGDVGSHAVSTMEHIDGALEAGGFFGALLRDPADPRRRLGLEVEGLQNINGVHDGYYITFDLSGGTPLNDKWMVSAGVTSTYASSNYMQTYFGVSANNALRSGLPAFNARAGFKDVSVNASLSYAFTDRWGMLLGGQYSRLLDTARDSPVVARAGSPDQYVVTLMATYQF